MKNKNKGSTISIRGSITANYCLLFLMGVILIAVLLLSYIFITLLDDFYNTSQIITNQANKQWSDIITHNKNLDDIRKRQNNLDAIYITNQNNNYIYHSGENLLKENIILKKDDGFSFKFIHKGYIISICSIEKNKSFYKILLFYNVQTFMSKTYTIFRLACYFTIFSCILISIFGFLKTKKLLKPIDQMTSTTKLITAQNLDLRIDVSDAKYELRELAQTTNEMINRLQNSYQNQQRFVSDVSHELRTPIAVILGYGNLLKRWGKEDPEILDEAIEAIINESENMQELVTKLLFLARYDKETLKYEFSVVNLSELIKDLVKETDMVDDTHIIESSIEDNINIFADDNSIKELSRVFTDNALKYTPENGTIFIGLSKEKDYAKLRIKDSGMGISHDDMGNVFKRFYRADESRNRDTGGHGLGLSIAKAIVLDHKGRIEVTSKENEGSIFDVYIPLYKNKKEY